MESDNEEVGMAHPTRVYVDEVLPASPRIATAGFLREHDSSSVVWKIWSSLAR